MFLKQQKKNNFDFTFDFQVIWPQFLKFYIKKKNFFYLRLICERRFPAQYSLKINKYKIRMKSFQSKKKKKSKYEKSLNFNPYEKKTGFVEQI